MTGIAKWRNTLDEPEFEKNLLREAPVFANINLLGKCNVDCYFCLGKDLNDEFRKHNELAVHFDDWPRFPEFLLRCKSAGIHRIYVTGQNTDSLMYRYLGELIDYVQDLGFGVGLRTNGYLAHRRMGEIAKCRRNVGYSIHTLSPATNWKIMRKREIPDWASIIPRTPHCRVSVVLNRYNEYELDDLLRYVAAFENVAYIQVRRICTDTREAFLIEDVRAYERVFERVRSSRPVVGYFYGAEVFSIYGKEVCFWRTVKTSIDSFNFYTDGTISDEYFVIEGYMREAHNFPNLHGVPIKPRGLEGFWKEKI